MKARTAAGRRREHGERRDLTVTVRFPEAEKSALATAVDRAGLVLTASLGQAGLDAVGAALRISRGLR